MTEPTAPPVPVALALGSNLGDRLASLRAAVKALSPFVQIEKIASVYETDAAYATDQPNYLNTTVIGTTVLEPLALLWTLKDLEIELGRTPTYRFGPRVIDIDILLYGDTVLHLPELTIPHASLAERDFVLRPLSEIAPAWQHPATQQSVVQMLAALPDEPMKCLGSIL